MKSRFSTEQIIELLQQQELGMEARELGKTPEMKNSKVRSITLDKGPEFSSMAFLSWVYDKKRSISIMSSPAS